MWEVRLPPPCCVNGLPSRRPGDLIPAGARTRLGVAQISATMGDVTCLRARHFGKIAPLCSNERLDVWESVGRSPERGGATALCPAECKERCPRCRMRRSDCT